MKKQLSYYATKLEEAGIDTSKFNLELNGVVLTVDELIKQTLSNEEVKNVLNNMRTTATTDADKTKTEDVKGISYEVRDLVFNILGNVVGEEHILSSSDALKPFALLAMRMEEMTTTDRNGVEKQGFDGYVRNCIPYSYQFEFINRYLKPDANSSFYELVSHFFTKDVIIATCEKYADKYDSKNHTRNMDLIRRMKETDDKWSAWLLIRDFIRSYNDEPWEKEFKAEAWKDAYKGFMNYCAIQYLIKEGKYCFVGCDKASSLKTLDTYLETYKNAPYKFYKLYKEIKKGIEE